MFSLRWCKIIATCAMFAALLTQMKSSKLSTSFRALQGSVTYRRQRSCSAPLTAAGRLRNSTKPSRCCWLAIGKKAWNDETTWKRQSGLMGVSKFAARQLLICNIGPSIPTVSEQSEWYLDLFPFWFYFLLLIISYTGTIKML